MTLTAKGLSLNISGKKILNNIDFSLNDKNFLGIVGPNGSGKSTLLKTFYKVLKPSAGYINLDGEDLKNISQSFCALKVAVLPQNHQDELNCTVAEAVHMGTYPQQKVCRQNAEVVWDKIAKILQKLHLEHLYDRRLNTLSGGERQMVMLARALVQDTKYLLLDEPTNHLDIYYQVHMLNVLKNVKKIVIAVFHDLTLAGKYCDYLYLMQKGTIKAQGVPEKVLNKELIGQIYGLNVEILAHPVTARPIVLL